jgi:uncharacterized protein (DUF3084 family)
MTNVQMLREPLDLIRERLNASPEIARLRAGGLDEAVGLMKLLNLLADMETRKAVFTKLADEVEALTAAKDEAAAAAAELAETTDRATEVSERESAVAEREQAVTAREDRLREIVGMAHDAG